MNLRAISAVAGMGLLLVMGGAGQAAAGECRKLSTPFSGEEQKYSVQAQVDGPVIFADIPCAVYWRNHEFCATELASFQATATVIDHPSGAAVAMTDAYFVVGAPGEKHPVAFADRRTAADFVAENGGELLDYEQLLSHSF